MQVGFKEPGLNVLFIYFLNKNEKWKDGSWEAKVEGDESAIII